MPTYSDSTPTKQPQGTPSSIELTAERLEVNAFSFDCRHGVRAGMELPFLMVEGSAPSVDWLSRRLERVVVLPPRPEPVPRFAHVARPSARAACEPIVAKVCLRRPQCLYHVEACSEVRVLWQQRRWGWFTHRSEHFGLYFMPPGASLTLLESQCLYRFCWRPRTIFRTVITELVNQGGALTLAAAWL